MTEDERLEHANAICDETMQMLKSAELIALHARELAETGCRWQPWHLVWIYHEGYPIPEWILDERA